MQPCDPGKNGAGTLLFRSLLHLPAQGDALHTLREAGIIVNPIRQSHLPSGAEPLQHNGPQSRPGGVQGGGISRGASSDDHNIKLLHISDDSFTAISEFPIRISVRTIWR